MKLNKKGFTLLELMIATTVFSVILLVCMGAFIQIGRLYYKGVTVSKTQEATRSIMDELTRAIQFSGDPIYKSTTTSDGNAYCIGLTRYSFVTGKKLVDGSTSAATVAPHVLWRDSESRSGCTTRSSSTATDFLGNPSKLTELVSEGMRINYLTLTPVGGSFDATGLSTSQVWKVSVSVAYGDDDLFEKNGGVTDYRKCAGSGVVGTQFCAVSELETTVVRRLQ